MDNLIDRFEKEKYLVIGHLTQEQCDILNGYKNLKYKLQENQQIIMWKDRVDHIKDRHEHEFDLDTEYYVNKIPAIISSPKYLGVHPNGNSIEFFGKINNTSEDVLVAIRSTSDKNGNLCFRSCYPVKSSRIESFLEKRRVVEI